MNITSEMLEAARREWRTAILEDGATDWRRILSAVAPLIQDEIEGHTFRVDQLLCELSAEKEISRVLKQELAKIKAEIMETDCMCASACAMGKLRGAL